MPDLCTLPEALTKAAASDESVCFVEGRDERRRSYASLLQSAQRVARSLVEAGLERGDLAALVINDAEQFLTALFGASMAGVIPASLYPPSAMSEMQPYLEQTANILRMSGARAVVTSAALKSSFESVGRASCPDLDMVLVREQLDAPPIPPDIRIRPDDIAFIQFTSGSTSIPKGIALTHESVSANVQSIICASGLDIGQGDISLSWLPLFHDMGLVGMTLGSVYACRPVVLMQPQAFVKRPADWLRAITRYAATVSFAPNFAYDLCVRRIKERDLDGLDLSSWRVAGCGAEPIHAGTLKAFADKFASVGFREHSLVPSYGLAEHVVAATFAPRGRAPVVHTVDADALTDERVARPSSTDRPPVALVCCGVPLPGHEVRIVGNDGAELPPRHVGEITLAGPSVMLGYYNDDAQTARAIRDGWLHTGDLGYLADGELFVCGRLKDVIIVNGRKYHPQDLEWAVDQLAGVRRGRVVAFGTAASGGRERVVIVAEPNGTSASVDLVDAIRRRVGDLCGLYVDEVILVPSGTVGRTTSGKVQRAATKTRYERGELAPAFDDRAGMTV
jgi:fatty-acyl-CoA synthase